MYRPRIIPVLLLRNQGLVKSVKFKDYKYIGDPINAVKLFNDMHADELVFLDILASKENRKVSLDFVRNVGDEANMPFSVGGGITSISDIKEILNAGAEKVVINSYATQNPLFIKEASDYFGSSTIVVCLDIKKSFWGKEQVYSYGGSKSTSLNPIEYAVLMEKMGAGELIIQSISNDGIMEGYDIPLIEKISDITTIPVVALGGCGSLSDFSKAIDAGASAAAAGSRFVFHGPRKGVLINYPSQVELNSIKFN